MPGPPKDVTPSALFAKLSEAPSPSEVYEYPRKGINESFRMFVLSSAEHLEAQERAHKKLAAKHQSNELDSHSLRAIYGDMVARELLVMAIRSVDPVESSEGYTGAPVYARVFMTADDLGRVTSDEVAVLFTMYQLTQAKIGPYENNIENEHQLTQWIDRLVTGASAAPLARCDWRVLVASSMFLARRAFLLTACLESQRSSLPPTLVSVLDDLGTGMCSYGKLPARLTQAGLASNGDWLLFDDEDLDAAVDDEMSDGVREAAKAAEQLYKHGD